MLRFSKSESNLELINCSNILEKLGESDTRR